MKHKSKNWKDDTTKKNVTKALDILHHEAPFLETEPYKMGTAKFALTSEIHRYLADYKNNRERNLVLKLPKRHKRKSFISCIHFKRTKSTSLIVVFTT